MAEKKHCPYLEEVRTLTGKVKTCPALREVKQTVSDKIDPLGLPNDVIDHIVKKYCERRFIGCRQYESHLEPKDRIYYQADC